MSCNKYEDHILIFPEDEANSKIALGFVLCSYVREDKVQILPYTKGWKKVIEKFKSYHIPQLKKYISRRLLLLIDFDNDLNRLSKVKSEVPEDLMDRVFILGTKTEPEKLKQAINPIRSFENIGKKLADECVDLENGGLWEHELIIINKHERKRLIEEVRPFLFDVI
ncbi:hypothetical protein [Desulfobacter latus]|uniref:Uncharacterized protein n=1 Tax=Desulfobacter latus TaxID=2292 RepID=A0A850T7E5_9BACT|nr:hypothetical protein [Desulfobacter latus]NWH05342.1 hypothetical protein [Desulfobacter latus]